MVVKKKAPINFPAEKMGAFFGLAWSDFWSQIRTIR